MERKVSYIQSFVNAISIELHYSFDIFPIRKTFLYTRKEVLPHAHSTADGKIGIK